MAAVSLGGSASCLIHPTLLAILEHRLFCIRAKSNRLAYFQLLTCLCLGYYFTGDGAYRTKKGYYQITGRMDDVINISGHRLGTAEIEDAMVSSKQVEVL